MNWGNTRFPNTEKHNSFPTLECGPDLGVGGVLHESRFGCKGFLSVIFGGECREEVGFKGQEGGIGEQRTGTIIILHFLKIAL